ncbi:hypothetical protein [Amnibacterium kyonggiense]|uniref:Uncharacterized protein n=1 Tax=Amnibacterium kyonggiense TaxID=595671 RepID=A0A4R7FER1_9MICO|nr:hypothetical protein [Amnibacterium kyonggiense]TDS74936.1 hypothetical protein CLV52_3460 [Amnibacterium kyonggiense]
MHLTDIEAALGAPASPDRVRGSGVFAWADPDGVVLFIGESSEVHTLMHRHELLRSRVIEALRSRPTAEIPVSGLGSVLARAGGLREACWPVPTAGGRRALRDALVRLAAVLGATPAAQGAESDVWHELREGDATSRRIIESWSQPDHPVQRLVPSARGSESLPEVPAALDPPPARPRPATTAKAARTRAARP